MTDAAASHPAPLPLDSASNSASNSTSDSASTPTPKRRREPLLSRRYTLEIRQHMAWPAQVLVLLLAVLVGMVLSGVILVAAGVPAGELFQEFVIATVFDAQSLQAVLFQASPMIMVGLAAAIAFRARFWNLGLEGQMVWGAIGATAISIFEIGPPALRLPLMLCVAAACGLLWALGPVLLKLRLGVNEIIATLMLNYIAGNFLLHLLYGAWKDPQSAFPHSPQFRGYERLPEFLGASGAAVSLALVAMLLAWWLVNLSRAGLYLRFVDANPGVAHATGVPTDRMVLLAVLVSGGLAGVAGFLVAAGQEGRLTQAFHHGYGFSGILIAFLARNHPIAASIVALLIATLFVAGRSLQVFYQIPFSMVQLIQAIIVICVASSDFFIRYRLRRVLPG